MSFSVEDLQAQISQSGGLAQKHQFMVQLPQLAGYTADLVELSLFCTVASIPGRQIMSQDHAIGTVNRKIANGFATTDMTLTFLVANNHAIRDYFEYWQSLAHNPVTKTVGYFEDYTAPVTIKLIERGLRLSLIKKQLGFTDKIPSFIRNRLPKVGPIDLSQGELDLGASFKQKETYSVKLLECFPTTMVDQAVGNAEEGVMELSVQLSFTDYESGLGDYTKQGESIGRGGLSALGALIGSKI
jgi:hypothetical protein